jgi:hypothetical protein
MFDLVCIITALFLAYYTAPDYRKVSLIVAAEFISHAIAFNYLFLEFREAHTWAIYLIYMIIQLIIFLFLIKHNASSQIMVLVIANVLYNLGTIVQHVHLTTIDFHGAYAGVVGTIMVLELAFLLRNSKLAAFYPDNRRNRRARIIDWFRRIHRRIIHWSTL